MRTKKLNKTKTYKIFSENKREGEKKKHRERFNGASRQTPEMKTPKA